LKWGAQNWMQYYRWGLTREERGEGEPSLTCWPHFLMHPRILFAFLAIRTIYTKLENL